MRKVMKSEVNEAIIIASFCLKVLKDRSSNRCYPNFTFKHFECDLLELSKSGYLHEIEVKLTRSDYKADLTKEKYGVKKHTLISEGKRVNHFSYLCPEGVISKEDLPPYAGLIYYTRGRLEVIVKPPLLSKDKVNILEFKEKAGDIMYYRYINKRIEDSLNK